MRTKVSNGGRGGFGTLEFAVSALMLFSLLFGGFAAAMLIQSWVQLNYMIDKRLRDLRAEAFTIERSSSELRLDVNEQSLDQYIDRLKSTLAGDVAGAVFGADMGAAGYFIESAYAVLDIDRASGEFKGILRFESSSQGAYRPSAELLSKTDLRREFLNSAQLDGAAAQRASLYAIPTSRFAGGGQSNFLPYSVLVGVRAFSSLQGSAAGKLYSALLGEPVTYSYKAVMLRGEVG